MNSLIEIITIKIEITIWSLSKTLKNYRYIYHQLA